MTLEITPLGENIIVLPDEPEKMAGALFLPTDALERPSRGTILAVGKDAPAELKAGARVLWQQHYGMEIEEDGVTYIILRPNDLVGIFDKKPVETTHAPPQNSGSVSGD